MTPSSLGSNQQAKAGLKGRLLGAEPGNCRAGVHVQRKQRCVRTIVNINGVTAESRINRNYSITVGDFRGSERNPTSLRGSRLPIH